FVAWLSVAPKAAGFVALFRVYFEGMGDRAATWVPIAAGLAALTIVAGNLMALPQQNTKRLLAYSGIAHIGYMLVGFSAASAAGVAMVLFYLVAYVFANMGAFLVVEAIARSEGSESTAAFRGLAQRSPLLALAMLIFLLSLGGIPFVAGFWAKLYVFWAAAAMGLYWLVLLGAVLTVVALFYYLLVAKRMYIEPPDPSAGRIQLSGTLALAVVLCALDVVLRESGVGKGNFYYHFKSKEELGYAILDQIIGSFLDRTLEPCFSDPEGRALTQIRCFLDRVLETQRERNCVGGCPLGNLASELSDVHEGFRARLASVFAAWRERLTLALRTEQLRGAVDSACRPGAVADFLVASLEGAILLTKLTKDITVMEQCVAEMSAIWLCSSRGPDCHGQDEKRWRRGPGRGAATRGT